jgi:hypothetical protein
MSEHKFTPGPWETLDLGEALIVQPTDKTLHPICLVDRQRNVFANAALIAAAPEMYESLSNILIWASTIASLYPGHERNEGTVEGDIADARAALAKAVKGLISFGALAPEQPITGERDTHPFRVVKRRTRGGGWKRSPLLTEKGKNGND